MEDPAASVCRLHPGVAVTGFCPACLRDRLAGLQPSSADLRRCKSFSYARSAAAVEPQRRSCDLFRHQQPPIVAPVPEELVDYRAQEQQQAPSSSRKSSSFLARKLQQWRRTKSKTKDTAAEMSSYSYDVRPSWSGAVPVPATMLALSVEEDMPPVPRSDGQIPVEEDDDDYCYYGYAAAVPGGSAQTRDYYLDSSSSSRRRRSVDRSGRSSFSDANNNNGGELPTTTSISGGNARVSPAVVGAERLYYHEAQSVLVHHHHHQYLRRADDDDFSGGSFGSAFRPHQNPASRPGNNKKGIRGWSIWGLINKKSSSSSRNKQPADDHHAAVFSSSAAAAGGRDNEHPWPELRARGYNGQMLRCNSSISARSSFSGSTIGRRSISGVDFRDHHETTRRRDEVLLDRTRSSSSSSYSRSAGNNPAMGMGRPPSIPRRPSSNNKHQQHEHRRSTLGLGL